MWVTPDHPFLEYLKTLNQETIKSLGEMQKNSEAEKVRDWPGACHYKAANAALGAHAPRLVLMGDSITQNWMVADPKFFSEDIVDRGIGGQTSPQMLARFMQDVVDLKPGIVHIMAGTNDIAGATGPTSVEDFENTLRAMVELARANHIKVIIGSILPMKAIILQPTLKPAPRVAQLNTWLRSYAADVHAEFVDYYGALAGPDGEFLSKFSNDGVHPTTVGYAIMRQMLEAAIGKLGPERQNTEPVSSSSQ
jgi:lysophospholipase L1-like esterase